MTPKETLPSSATHVALPGTRWSLWQHVVLRAPGFPAGGVDLLASTELAAAADGLTEREIDDAGQWSRCICGTQVPACHEPSDPSTTRRCELALLCRRDARQRVRLAPRQVSGLRTSFATAWR
jgi:hypothetical protein